MLSETTERTPKVWIKPQCPFYKTENVYFQMLELLSKMHLDEGRTLKKIFSPGFTLDWISTPGTMFLLIFRITGASQVKNTPANAGDSKRLELDPWVRKIPWGRKWQSTPVFLPGKSHGQRSLAGCRPWGREEWDMTEQHRRNGR